MHVWGQFGVIVGPQAHIEASTELGAKSLLMPDFMLLFSLHLKKKLIFRWQLKFANHFFMPIQVDGIKEIADHVTKLTRAGPGLGELLYDKDLA